MNDLSFETAIENLKDDRILLVGGAGFIGHNLALTLREYGLQVRVMDNLAVNSVVDHMFNTERGTHTHRLYNGFLFDRLERMRDAGVELVNGDARRMQDVDQVMLDYEPTKVVHLSAIASAVEARKNPGACFELQLITLQILLEHIRMRKSKVDQIMIMSSSTVYGDFEGESVDEQTRPRPKGIYANTKFMAERLVRTYCHQYGFNTTIVRPSALYGERCVSRRVSQVFIENALSGKPLLLEDGGDGRLDFTYIADLIEGMIRALAFQPRTPGTSNTFNITYGNARSIAELAAIVKEVVPDAILEERPRAPDKPVRGTLSTARAKERLGFEARWPLDVGYRKYCEWYVEQWERAKRNDDK